MKIYYSFCILAKIGELLIRCNNVLYIRGATSEGTVEEGEMQE